MVTSQKNDDPNHQNSKPAATVLIVGNYCHDVILQNDVVLAETLGGASSFIANVLDPLSICSHLVSKVGPDFKYQTSHDPIIVPTSKTTVFHAHFGTISDCQGHQDRVLNRVEVCDQIKPSDLPDDRRFDYGMAVGVGGEIPPETLEKMVEICDSVVVDIQSVIRKFGENDGVVNLVKLKDSGYYHLLPRIGFLKASSEEALFMEVEEVRKLCCVVVTHGKDGCEVFRKDESLRIDPFEVGQVDPTGAGDSFLGGLVFGLVHGLSIADALLLGNLFGSITVAQIGLPKFHSRLLQSVKDEVRNRQRQSINCCKRQDDSNLVKPAGHDEFHASLCSARLTSNQTDVPSSPATIPPCNGQL